MSDILDSEVGREVIYKANIDHPHTGLQIGTDCVEAVLRAALPDLLVEHRRQVITDVVEFVRAFKNPEALQVADLIESRERERG